MTNNAKVATAVIAALVIGVPLAMKMSGDKTASARPIDASPEATTACGSSTTGVCGPDGKGKPAATGALPRFVDIGTTTCAPCKAMLRVMEELEQQYPGALRIEFVNVRDDPDNAAQYGVRVIPTQIFYSPEGKELYRHTGVFPTRDVVAKWKELGYELAPRKEGQ
jgi:thioredoxin 1